MTTESREAESAPPLVQLLRRINGAVGFLEQVALAVLLLVLIGVGTTQALTDQIANKTFAWSAEVIRYTVFYIAMFGAALASQQLRMISMDVLTRLFGPRGKAVLRIATGVMVISVCLLLVLGGLDARESTAKLSSNYELISPATGLLALPLGAALIAFHFALHAIMDATYLFLGITPPEEEEAKVA